MVKSKSLSKFISIFNTPKRGTSVRSSFARMKRRELIHIAGYAKERVFMRRLPVHEYTDLCARGVRVPRSLQPKQGAGLGR